MLRGVLEALKDLPREDNGKGIYGHWNFSEMDNKTFATLGDELFKDIQFITAKVDRFGNNIKAVKTAEIIFQTFGVMELDEEEKLLSEDDDMGIGERALQIAYNGVRLEDYVRLDRYMQLLRDHHSDDNNTSTNSNEEALAGIAVLSRCVDEKLGAPKGSTAKIWPLVATQPEFFNLRRVNAYLEYSGDIAAVADYFYHPANEANADIESKLIAIEQMLAPKKDEAAIAQELQAMAQKMAA